MSHKKILRYNREKQCVEESDAPTPVGSSTDTFFLGNNVWATGHRSDALSVHPDQAKEFNEDAKRMGFTGISWEPDGTYVATSKKQHNQWMKLNGYYNRDAGYGDAAPDNV